MGDLIRQLTDVIYFKNKQVIKRVPFSDLSNGLNMKTGHKSLSEKKTRCNKKEKMCCSVAKTVKNPECMQLKELKVVLNICEWKDCGITSKVEAELANSQIVCTPRNTKKRDKTVSKDTIDLKQDKIDINTSYLYMDISDKGKNGFTTHTLKKDLPVTFSVVKGSTQNTNKMVQNKVPNIVNNASYNVSPEKESCCNKKGKMCCSLIKSVKNPECIQLRELKVVLNKWEWKDYINTSKVEAELFNSQINCVKIPESMQLRELKVVLNKWEWKDYINTSKVEAELTNSQIICTSKNTKKKDKIVFGKDTIDLKQDKIDINNSYLDVDIPYERKNRHNAHTLKMDFPVTFSVAKGNTQNTNKMVKYKVQNIVNDASYNISPDYTSPIIKRLRHGVKKNYLETSDLSIYDKNSVVISKTVERVPIYKQVIVKDNKQKDDPYELDLSDSEGKKSNKLKLKRKNLSEKHDKTMYNIIMNLEKKQKKKHRKKAVSATSQKYKSNVQEALQRVMKKVNSKTNKNVCLNKQLDTGQGVNIPPILEQLIGDKTQSENLIKPQNSQNSEFRFNIFEVSDKSEYPKLNKDINDESEQCRYSSAVSLTSEKEYNEAHSPLFMDDSDTENDEFFGFDEEGDIPKLLQPKDNRINVISNVLVNSSVPQHQNLVAQKQSLKSPWRMNTMKNSNYVVLYKNNAMPCLKQDAVVNYNLVQGIEKSFSNINNLRTSQRSQIQTSILDYMDSPHGTRSNCEKENIPEKVVCPSLYDYEDFENLLPNRLMNENRTVLGAVQDKLNNKCVVSTPLKGNGMSTMPSLEVSFIGNKPVIQQQEPSSLENMTIAGENESFGFNSLNSVVETQTAPTEARPFRISVGTIKDYKRKVASDEIIPETKAFTDDFASVLIDNALGEHSHEVKIFDDVDPEVSISIDASIQYGRKGRRRQRLASVTSECSDDEKPKKKKKTAMTKSEEEEFEKWAAQFNAMCSEIEKHDLEIE